MEKMKWVYTFVLLFLTVAWAVFTVEVVMAAMAVPTSASVLEASGTSVFLGALLTWNANINKHWFGGEKTPAVDKPEG